MLTPRLDPSFYVAFFVGAAVVLAALGVFAVLWRQAWTALAALVARGAYRLGLYDPASTERVVHSHKRDSGFILFSKILRAATRLVPGDPNRHPHTFIIPIVCLGIPTFVALFVLLWAIPLALLGYVWGLGSGTMVTVAGYLGLFVYAGGVVLALKQFARIPSYLKQMRHLPK